MADDEYERDPRLTDLIKQRAYGLWEKEGRPMDRDRQHWLQAEREVMLGVGLRPPTQANSGHVGGTPGALATGSIGRQMD